MIKKVKIVFLSILFLIAAFFLYAEEKNYNWYNVSGEWKTAIDQKGGFLFNSSKRYINWGYSEIIDFHSILTFSPLSYSSIQFGLEINNPVKSPVEIMIPFSLKDFKNFYAFKFVIDNYKDNELRFISSTINNPSLDKAATKNFTITTLQKKKFSLEFDKIHNIEIKVNKNTAVLFIDGNKEMEAQAAENLSVGKIGFSGRNTKLRIRNVKILNGDKTVLEDDFSSESIKRITVKATQVK